MNVVMMCRRLGLVLVMGMMVVVVVTVSASNSEPTLLVHPNLRRSTTTAEGEVSPIAEADQLRLLRYPSSSVLDIVNKPAPGVHYPPPPTNPGVQHQNQMDSTVPSIISHSLMEMVLTRSEELMEALLVNRFHLRGLDNLPVKSFPKFKPRPAPKGYPPPPKTPLADNNARPAPKGYPPPPKTPLADNNARPAPKGYPPPPKTPLADNNARPAPKGYPPSPKTPLADVYQEQYNQANINGLEEM